METNSPAKFFMASLWVVEYPEVGKVHLCIYTSKIRLRDRTDTERTGDTETEIG